MSSSATQCLGVGENQLEIGDFWGEMERVKGIEPYMKGANVKVYGV